MKNYGALIILIFITLQTQAQFHEIGAFGGVSGYVGDLNPTNYFRPSGNAFGAFYRHNYNTRFSYKISAAKTSVLASDSDNPVSNLQERNLAFETPIYELAAVLEVSYFDFEVDEGENKFTPYMNFGVALFHYNPIGTYNGQEYNLRELGTEGQLLPGGQGKYSTVSVAFPLGLGMRYNFAGKWSLNAEIALRYTATDYLDDAGGVYTDQNEILDRQGEAAAYFSNPSSSNRFGEPGQTRASSTFNDTYTFATFGISYTIKPFRCPRLSDF